MYIMESAPGPKTLIDGREVDYFSGCGYFDLQGHPEIIRAVSEAVKRYGIACATSPLVYGNNQVLTEVVEKTCRFFRSENALYFASGYLGNSILLDGLKDKYEIIFVDKESHYSVLNAVSISQKPAVYFNYRDAADLSKKLKKNMRPSQRPLLICDGVFPISGDISPLSDYRTLLNNYDDSIICVDDAHAVGVIGEKGRGVYEYLRLQGERLFSCGTLSKAFGAHGGIIAGSHELINELNEKSNIHHACSPVPIPIAAAAVKAFEILSKNPGMREQLWDNVAYAKKKLRALGFTLDDSPVPIICLHSKERVDFKALQLELFDKNLAVIYLPPGGYTSVPAGGAVRISIFSSHSREQIDRLVDTIKRLI